MKIIALESVDFSKGMELLGKVLVRYGINERALNAVERM